MRGNWSLKRIVGVAVIVGVVGALLATFFIKAEKRRVVAVIRGAERAIEAADAEWLRDLFVEDFDYQGVTYRHLEEVGVLLLESISPVGVWITSKKVEITGSRAHATIDVIARPGPKSSLVRNSWSRWRVGLVKREGGWKINRVDNLAVDDHGGYRLEELVRQVGVVLQEF